MNVDTILLAHYARLRGGIRAVEFGCAHGAVSLIIARRLKDGREASGRAGAPFWPIDAFDINPSLIGLAKENAALNGLSGEVNFFTADLRECRDNFEAGSYDAVVMNPPYDEPDKSRPSPVGAMASALHWASCCLADVVGAARYLLKNGGKFFLVMRAKRTAELFSLLNQSNVRPKRLRVVHPRPGRAASVVLVEAVRASGDGLVIEPPLFILGSDGKYTPDLLEAYRLGETADCGGTAR